MTSGKITWHSFGHRVPRTGVSKKFDATSWIKLWLIKQIDDSAFQQKLLVFYQKINFKRTFTASCDRRESTIFYRRNPNDACRRLALQQKFGLEKREAVDQFSARSSVATGHR